MIKCVLNVITLFFFGPGETSLPKISVVFIQGEFSGKNSAPGRELMMGCVGSNEEGQKPRSENKA